MSQSFNTKRSYTVKSDLILNLVTQPIWLIITKCNINIVFFAFYWNSCFILWSRSATRHVWIQSADGARSKPLRSLLWYENRVAPHLWIVKKKNWHLWLTDGLWWCCGLHCSAMKGNRKEKIVSPFCLNEQRSFQGETDVNLSPLPT